MNDQAKKPSWLWFLVAGLVLVAGVVGFGMMLYWSIAGMVEGLERVEAPATWDVQIDKPGRKVIYHEHVSNFGGRAYSQWPGGVDLNIQVTRDGTEVPVRPYPGNANYSFGRRKGVAMSVFDADQPGRYTLKIEASEPAVVALGEDLMGSILSTVFGSMGICFGSVLLALALVIVTIVRMSRYRRAMRQAEAAAVAGPGTFGQPPMSL